MAKIKSYIIVTALALSWMTYAALALPVMKEAADNWMDTVIVSIEERG